MIFLPLPPPQNTKKTKKKNNQKADILVHQTPTLGQNYFRFRISGSVVVDFLFIVTAIVGVCYCSMLLCTLLYVHSSIAIILMGKRELVALLNFSSWCPVMVGGLFPAVPLGCLRFVIVVFPDHTRLQFLNLRFTL